MENDNTFPRNIPSTLARLLKLKEYTRAFLRDVPPEVVASSMAMDEAKRKEWMRKTFKGGSMGFLSNIVTEGYRKPDVSSVYVPRVLALMENGDTFSAVQVDYLDEENFDVWSRKDGNIAEVICDSKVKENPCEPCTRQGLGISNDDLRVWMAKHHAEKNPLVALTRSFTFVSEEDNAKAFFDHPLLKEAAKSIFGEEASSAAYERMRNSGDYMLLKNLHVIVRQSAYEKGVVQVGVCTATLLCYVPEEVIIATVGDLSDSDDDQVSALSPRWINMGDVGLMGPREKEEDGGYFLDFFRNKGVEIFNLNPAD